MTAAPVPEGTFVGSDTKLASFVARPVRRFLEIEASSGVLMLAATVIALIWANSPWSGGYSELWHTPIEVTVGGVQLAAGGHHLDLQGLVNDGLMALFFFVAGLEIKSELVSGQLRSPKAAALPAFGALGGMVVPALIFFAFNSGTDASSGWGIPMATDIAFAVGVISLLGDRVDRRLRVFLLTLAIVDDLGAIAVIAIVYTESIGWSWLAAAGGIVAAVLTMRMLKVWYVPIYVVAGVALWVTMLQSGIHATVAGVLMGLMTPAKPLQSRADARRWVDWLRDKDDEIMAVDVNYAAFHMRESHSVAERLMIALHPVSSFMIVPVFALANAGVPLGGDVLANAAGSPVTWGVAVGLVVGKALGITLFTGVAAKTGIAALPSGVNMRQIAGLAAVGGVGFTVSLFVTGLAFDSAALQTDAKIGILGGSACAAAVGLLVLARVCRPKEESRPARAGVADSIHELVESVQGARVPA